jgi:hypothetical protein
LLDGNRRIGHRGVLAVAKGLGAKEAPVIGILGMKVAPEGIRTYYAHNAASFAIATFFPLAIDGHRR